MFRERIQRAEGQQHRRDYPDLPQRVESEIVVVEETETSPSKSLAVLHVAGGKRVMVRETVDRNKESLIVGGEGCLLSSSDEGSEGLEKFLHDNLNSFSGEGLDRIVEVEPTVVLELLDENLVDRGGTVGNVIAVDEEMPRNRVEDISRSQRQEKRIGSVIRLCDVDIGAADERLSKSVDFQFDNVGGGLSVASVGADVTGGGVGDPHVSR